MNLIPAFIRRRIAHRPNLVKIVDNIGWLFFDNILRMGVGLLVGVWVARYLGPEQFGLFNFATAFVGLFGAIAGLGLQGLVVRDIVRDQACKEETLGTTAALQLMGGLLTYGLILGAIFWLRPDDNLSKLLVAILGSSMLFKASEVTAYWFESEVLSKYIVWVQNSVFLVFSAIKVALILSHATLISFAWATMAEALAVALLMCLVFRRCGQRLRQLRVRLLRATTLLKDSWPLMLSGIAIVIYMKIDQIMLGQMVGDEAVGIYSAATRISEVWYFIPMAIVASVFPSILEVKKRSEEQYYARLQKLYDLMVVVSVAVALPMTFLSTPVVVLLFGDAYLAAGTVLALHIWAAVFVFLGVASGKWFLAENRQLLSLQRTVLGAVVNVGLNLWLIPVHGAIGAALATIFSYAIAAFFADLLQKETRRMFSMKVSAMNPLAIYKRYI
jgi:PST family polysaccharide transporter